MGGPRAEPRRRMAGLGRQRSPCQLLLSSLAACLLVLLSHLALASIPRFFAALTLVAMLPLSVLILAATVVLRRCIRWVLGISAPAPAVVAFNILFIWGVYAVLLREGNPSLLDALINGGCALLLYGLYRIHSGDPGLVASASSCLVPDQDVLCEVELQYKNSALFERVRICDSCKARVKGFDHHCPAFGTCIGQKNHRLFILLIIGFILVESSYISCSTRFITKFMDTHRVGFEDNFSGSLIIGTLLFSILQVIWQALFLIWHIYCICINIRTDEWINWRKYPEFQHVIQPQLGYSFLETSFTNPYSKGIIGNIKDFLKTMD